MKFKTRKKSVPIIVTLSILIFGYLIIHASLLAINLTPSMPIGLYYRTHTTHLTRHAIVAVCLPKTIANIGQQRGYLLAGHCPDHSMAVIKTVIALPHDSVVLTPQFMSVNQHRYFAPHAIADHNHLTIPQQIGYGTHHDQTVWLYGAHAPRQSWDSRYYGGVPVSNIIGVYKPLIIF